jgi:hypothetical protein
MWKTGNQMVSLSTKTWRHRNDFTSDETTEIFHGMITVMPDTVEPSGLGVFRLSASFQQRIWGSGYYSLKPTLTVSAVVPLCSKVFFLAKIGDLNGIRKLCQDGHASLTDCDTDGGTLLQV